MSPVTLIRPAEAGRFPRVSGDEPSLASVTSSSRAFSPRERG